MPDLAELANMEGLAGLSPAEVTARLGGVDCDPSGWFVYCLWDAAGQVIYVGESGNVFRRVGDHYNRRDRQALIAKTTLIRCASEDEMHLVETWLIRRFQPVLNIFGTDDPEGRLRAKLDLAEPPAPEVDPAPPLEIPGRMASMRSLGDALLALIDAGTVEVAAEHLVSLASAAGRSRTWMYPVMDELVARGVATVASEVPRAWRLDVKRCREEWAG